MNGINLSIGTLGNSCKECIYSYNDRSLGNHIVRCSLYDFYPFSQFICKSFYKNDKFKHD